VAVPSADEGMFILKMFILKHGQWQKSTTKENK